MIMSKIEQAVERFKNGYSCSQAIFSTYAPIFDVPDELAIKISTGLGGGIGRTAGICGAVSGAVLVLGLKFGSPKSDPQNKEMVYAKVREFLRLFNERHNTVNCRELLGCDISTPEGFNKARSENLFKTICPNYVRSSAEILEQLLEKPY